MASKYGRLARPKRAGETFARAHHGQEADEGGGASFASGSTVGGPDSKRVKFDVRNPSALAPDAPEDEDAVLEADVIGSSAATKRGAVNLDGYDSDSDNENFDARAKERAKGLGKDGKGVGDGADLDGAWDGYGGKAGGSNGKKAAKDEDDEDDDMFAADDDDDGGRKKGGKGDEVEGGKKKKEVRFMDSRDIQGEVGSSRDRSQIKVDFLSGDQAAKSKEEESSSDDDENEAEAAAAEAEELDVDEEVGLGGLKKHAPRVEAFNMKQEQEEGRFDESGNYIRKAGDPDAVHDRWLEGVSKKEVKKAAAAQQKREEEMRRQRLDDDALLTADVLADLIRLLERSETPLEALQRLGKESARLNATAAKGAAGGATGGGGAAGGSGGAAAKTKVPAWRLRKMQEKEERLRKEGGAMDVEEHQPADDDNAAASRQPDKSTPLASSSPSNDAALARVKAAIDAVTDAADRLLGRDFPEVYDSDRAVLQRAWRRETGDEWDDSVAADDERRRGIADRTRTPGAEEDDDEEGGARSRLGRPAMWEYRWTDGRDGGELQGPFPSDLMAAWKEAGYFAGPIEFRGVGEDGWRTEVDFA